MPDSIHPKPPAPPPKVGRPIFGDYQVEGELGRGGMGVVFRARQRKLNRLVALKMLTGHYGPEELARFRAEAETAAGLHHTNIVQIYEVGEDHDTPFFAMEYIETGSLADRLRRGPIPDREAVELLISVARALHFAHQNGVIHRDMKPANVLLDPEGVPKVTDFGIAKRLKGDSALTLTGAVIGTPTYMAPEQAKGTSRHVGAPADVYSLGAILYEMLAGRPPFLPEESETALTVRVITEDPVSPAWHRPGVPRDLETICLKCLEKEPRDRYPSAAAFAEDLRRFLEDESIVARPPTTLARTAKWIRRHPWRFLVGMALVLTLATAGHRLWQWEFYQRPQVEYSAAVDYVHGSLQPISSFKKSDLARRGVSLRLTRRGRNGPVTLVEVLNSRGNPAVLRPIMNGDVIPIYIESLLGAQPNSEKAPESTRVEFIYDGTTAVEATGRDRNGTVNWRILYDRAVSSKQGRTIVRARFANLWGFAASNRTGASHMEFERDSAGRDLEVRFFDGNGEPTTNGEHVYAYKLERDGKGRITRLTNLDREGKPQPNRVGLVTAGFRVDSADRVNRIDALDANGQSTEWNGIAWITIDYDSTGNTTRVARYGPDGKYARVPSGDWNVHEFSRNNRGELAGHKFFNAGDDNTTPVLMSETILTYDAFGHPSEIQSSNSRLALGHDQNGNVTEEKYLDSSGQPVVGDQGYALKRVTYQFDANGSSSIETYFGIDGAKVFSKGGYHRRIVEFSAAGVLKRFAAEELDPAKWLAYREVSEPEYDPRGRLRRSVLRYENKKGELALDATRPYAALEETYDENGRVILSWQLGCPESSGAPTFRTDTEWHRTGARKRVVRQACDRNRKALESISTGTGARYEEEFDEIDRRERIYETGFDEKRVGFNVREARFSQGKLQNVIHQKSNGSRLDTVRVLIMAVFPEQAKASELKQGDQLLLANDTPIRSAYDWAFTLFSGGWIEILREGNRVRIDGFEPGAVGMILEDIAPDVSKDYPAP